MLLCVALIFFSLAASVEELWFLSKLLFAEIDNEGVIEPDKDEPQEMGDENLEVMLCFLKSRACSKEHIVL